MKKQLIAAAVAAMASTGALAQNVTVSGVLDFAGASVSGSQLNVKGTSFSTTVGNSATSVIRITAVEDLGGGMKVTALYGLDPRSLSNDGLTTAGTTATSTGLNRDELFVGLEGSFGNIRLGSPNSIGLTTYLSTAPLGTGVGSGYAATQQDFSAIRYSRSARYDSPSFNGFRFAALYAPGNDEVITAGAPAQLIANSRRITEFGLSYASGPLTIQFANLNRDRYINDATATNNGVKTSVNVLGARYQIGDTTLFAGYNDGDAAANVAAATPSKGSRFGVSHAMGAITLHGQYVSQKTNNVAEDVLGFRGDYNLSKRSAVYLGYENWDNGDATASATVNRGTRKITSLGLRHSF